jgi:excisionase family DNA binding protein
MNEILTSKEVANYLRISEATLYKLISNGEIPAFRIATAWRFTRDGIENWLIKKVNNKGGVNK